MATFLHCFLFFPSAVHMGSAQLSAGPPLGGESPLRHFTFVVSFISQDNLWDRFSFFLFLLLFLLLLGHSEMQNIEVNEQIHLKEAEKQRSCLLTSGSIPHCDVVPLHTVHSWETESSGLFLLFFSFKNRTISIFVYILNKAILTKTFYGRTFDFKCGPWFYPECPQPLSKRLPSSYCLRPCRQQSSALRTYRCLAGSQSTALSSCSCSLLLLGWSREGKQVTKGHRSCNQERWES